MHFSKQKTLEYTEFIVVYSFSAGSNITNSIYLKKVNEIEFIVDEFNSDLTYYLSDFKNRLKYIDFDITFLISFLHEASWKEMTLFTNSQYNSMITYIKN